MSSTDPTPDQPLGDMGYADQRTPPTPPVTGDTPLGEIPVNQLPAETRVKVDPEYAAKIARLMTWSKAKAVWGAISASLVAGLIVLWTALSDDTISGQEVVQIALAVLGAPAVVGGTVYRTANKPKTG